VGRGAHSGRSAGGHTSSSASCQLVRTQIENDLVDELHLLVVPVALAIGERVVGGTSDEKTLRLAESRRSGAGVAMLAYKRV
jgi:dihydrofolate reductase